MKRRLLIIVSMICLLFAALFVGCGETPTSEPAVAETYTVTVVVNKSDYGKVSVSRIPNVALGTEIVIEGNKMTVGTTEVVATATESSSQYTYSFEEWDWKEVNYVTENITITANFTRVENVYTVNVVSNNDDYGTVGPETIENVPYGTVLAVSGNTLAVGNIAVVTALARQSDGQYVYALENWSTVGKVTEDVTITANFARELLTYTVNVVSSNESLGSVNVSTVANVLPGTAISINGNKLTVGDTEITATPKESDGKFAYSFEAWDTQETVTGNITITANFTKTYVGELEGEVVQALEILADGENHYGYFWHGAANALTWDEGKVEMSVTQNANTNAGVGTTLYPSTIQKLYDLGFKKITFMVNAGAGSHVGIFTDVVGLEYLTSASAIVKDTNTYYFVANGTEVTIDLSILAGNAAFMNTECGQVAGGLHFVVMTGTEFISENIYKSATALTLDNIRFTELSAEELAGKDAQDALNSLASSVSYFGYFYHGYANGLELNANDLTISVVQGTNAGAGAGTTLTPTAIQKLYDLGFKCVTFTVSAGAGSHVAIFTDVVGLEYLTSASEIVKDTNTYYFVANGTEITIDLSVLVGDATFMNTECGISAGGLHFAVMTGDAFVGDNLYTSATTIMLANINFAKASAEEITMQNVQRALNALASSDNHYWYYYHGAAQNFELNGNTLVWTVAKNANNAGVGTTLKPSTIQMLYDLGFKKITFTLGIESGLYCALFIDNDTGLNYLSGTSVAVDVNDYYFYQNGTEITIDLEALVNNADFMNTACSNTAGGLHFVVLTGAEFNTENLYTSETTITLTDIQFE